MQPRPLMFTSGHFKSGAAYFTKELHYSNINCSARGNVFVHSLAQMGGKWGQSKIGGQGPLASLWNHHWPCPHIDRWYTHLLLKGILVTVPL